MTVMRPTRSVEWTQDRIAALTTPDVRQLRANAERLNDPEVMKRCDAVLGGRPALRARKKKAVQPGGAA